MECFNVFISRFNFKKAVVIYLLILILAGVFSAGLFAYTFRDKLTFLYEYHRISEKVEDSKNGLEAMKPALADLADASPDMVDILILNGKNQILYSAKHSDLSQNGTVDLTPDTSGNPLFFTDRQNPEFHFRLMKGDKLTLSVSMLGIENKVKQEYEDRYFYESGFAAQKVYLLSYIADRTNGQKVYIISDVLPVAGGDLYIKVVAAIAMLFFMLYWVLLALWVYARALGAKLNASVWGIVTLFTNLAGLFVFFLYRQGGRTCYKCGALQNKLNVYCTFCGTKLGSVCKKCNTAADEKDRYCKNCGSALDEEKNQDE